MAAAFHLAVWIGPQLDQRCAAFPFALRDIRALLRERHASAIRAS
jgi:hypothetical protein